MPFTEMGVESLQETYGPTNACFGCGPANPMGLKIRSFPKGDVVVADWRPERHHEAFPNVLCGGIIGTILDCHSNWTASWHLKRESGSERIPYTVTAEYLVKLLEPTPSDEAVHLVARVTESGKNHAVVEATLVAHKKICATFRGTFVSVKPGHPAYGRW